MEKNNKKLISKRWLIRIAAAVLVLVLAVAAGEAVAKYVRQKAVKGSLKIVSALGAVDILEHEATDHFGIYTADDGAAEVKENTYGTLPGVDVFTDPFVRIAGKTSLPAYLYVEIVGSDTDSAKYCLVNEAAWQVCAGAVGPNGGSIYVYIESNEPALIEKGKGNIDANGSSINDIPVLADNKAYMSEMLTSAYDGDISFYAYMISAAEGETPFDVFNSVYGSVMPDESPYDTGIETPTGSAEATPGIERIGATCYPVVDHFAIRSLESAYAAYGTNSSASVTVPVEGYPVFVRAYYTVNWVNAAGNVYGTAPVLGTDYTLGSMGANWFRGPGNFWYYPTAVGQAEAADLPFIASVQLKSGVTPPEGYTLKLDVVVQTIQAIGWTDEGNDFDGPEVPFVTAAWGVAYSYETLTVSVR